MELQRKIRYAGFMTTDESRNPTDGAAWENYAAERLRAHHAAADQRTELVAVPADDEGDLGVDLFTRTGGTLYQCYVARDWNSAHDLYEKQRDKLTKDVGKLLKPDKQKDLQALFGTTVIKEWILVVPKHRSRKLIQHANTKAQELKAAASRPAFLDPNIIIHVWTEADLLANTYKAGAAWAPPAVKRDPWGEKVWNAKLWRADAADTIKRAAADVAGLCWTWVNDLDEDKANPWRDPAWPCRAVDLFNRLGGLQNNLRDEETALLLTAPFLRHAALASAEPEAWRRARPESLDPDKTDAARQDDLRRAYETLLSQRPQLERKARRLLAKGGDEGRQTAWWLLHRALLRLPQTWRTTKEEAEGGLFPDDFHKELHAAWAGAAPVLRDQGGKWGLELAHSVTRTAADLTGDGAEKRLPRQQPFATDGGATNDARLHLRLLGMLSALAGRAAFDPLLLPEVLVDHIGLSEPISPADIINHLAGISWTPADDGKTLTLGLTCDHPAVDHACEAEIEHINRLRHDLTADARKNPLGLEGLNDWPELSPDGLKAAAAGDKPAYARPHVHFTLAQDEVRELLMGERLYGDPGLAVRELYQNALDACRYRETRLRWALKDSGSRKEKPNWEGEIEFEQGVDSVRGPYIECRDNGVGMRHDDLLNCFAKAGRRFTDSEEYLEEKAAWRKHGLEHYPNSQFGIGVFSYFMLAEELEITTRRAGRDGQPLPETLRATVSGSGSLFRVRPADRPLPDAGTTIRLYLNRTTHRDKKGNERRISALEILKDQLWVAQYPTRATEGDKEYEWEPGVLDRENAIPTEDPDVWWFPDRHASASSGNGFVLVDGVRTAQRFDHAVVNLRGERRPALTADRKQILNWSGDWVEESLTSKGWRALLDRPLKNLETYWNLAEAYPAALQNFIDDKASHALEVRFGYGRTTLRRIGLFYFDQEIDEILRKMSPTRPGEILSEWSRLVRSWPAGLLAWRLTLRTEANAPAPRFILRWVARGLHDVPSVLLGPIHAKVVEEGYYARSADFSINNISKSIVHISHIFKKPVKQVIAAIQPLTDLGFREAEFDNEKIDKIGIFDDIDVVLFVERRSILITLMSIFNAARQYQLKHEELLIRLEKWAALGIAVPVLNPELWRLNRDLDITDIELLSGGRRFPVVCLPAWRIFAAQGLHGETADLLPERLAEYSELGIEIPAVEPLLQRPLDDIDEKILNLPNRELPPQEIRPAAVLYAAATTDATPQTMLDRLQDYRAMGFIAPDLTADDLGGLDEIDGELLYRFREGEEISTTAVLSVLEDMSPIPDDLSQRLARYRRCGATIPNIDIAPLLINGDLDAVHKMLGNSPDGALSSAAIINTAVGQSPDALRRRIEWCRDNGVTVPAVDIDALDRLPAMDMQDADIIGALDDKEGRGELTFDDLDAVAIIYRFKREDFAVRLEKWRAAGFTVPDIAEFDAADTFNPENYG